MSPAVPVRVVRALFGDVEIGFTVQLVDLPPDVQNELFTPVSSGECKVDIAIDRTPGKPWAILLTPRRNGLYSAREAGLLERTESPGEAGASPDPAPSGTVDGGF